MSAQAPSEFRDFIENLAQISADVILPYFKRADLVVESKSDATPVTEADRKAEEVIRAEIQKAYPGHGIIGEEYGEHQSDAEFVWVLDPIDGTVSFAHGIPLFGTLIALLQNGRPILGAIHQPVQEELLIGDNDTTTLNGEMIRVSDNADLASATVLTTDPRRPSKRPEGGAWESLVRDASLYRGWGDCYGYLMVATGRADLMADPIIPAIWDKAALVPVICGAGGAITTWDGGDPMQGDSILAGSPAIHRQAIERLKAAVTA